MSVDSHGLTTARSAIPIENIYYLLSYAWDMLPESGLVSVDVQPEMRIQDLLASVLRNGVSRLLKRGLDRAYVEHVEEIAGIRGRVAVGASLKRLSFPRARAICRFDELSPDVLHNRIIKTTLRGLAAATDLNRDLAEDLRDQYRRFAGVSEIRLTMASFRRVTLGRNTRFYRFLIDVCEIINRNLLVDEHGGRSVFRDFTRDDRQMGRLFERFLRSFYSREQSTYHISAPRFLWNAEGQEKDLAYLPQMQTDIVLRSRASTIVIDAKYYFAALSEHFSKLTLQAEHLYQMFSYMSHVELGHGDARRVRGILLYPRTTRTISINVSLFDRPFRAATINLDQTWPGVHADLLSIIS